MPVVFDITALLSGYLIHPEWVIWHFLKDRNNVQNQTQMSGSEHTAGKIIVPSAVMYWDVSPWKHHRGGPRAGPRGTDQWTVVDWL